MLLRILLLPPLQASLLGEEAAISRSVTKDGDIMNLGAAAWMSAKLLSQKRRVYRPYIGRI